MPAGSVLFTKLVVADMAAAIGFYERVFGFVERRRIATPTMEEVLIALPDDGFTLVLYRHTDGRALTVGNAHGPLGLTTRDIDATWGDAIAAGAVAVTPPYDLPAMRVAFLGDPEGHSLELIQYKRPMSSKEPPNE